MASVYFNLLHQNFFPRILRSLIYHPTLPLPAGFDRGLNSRVCYSVSRSLNALELLTLLSIETRRVAPWPVTTKYLIIFTNRKIKSYFKTDFVQLQLPAIDSHYIFVSKAVKLWHSDLLVFILPSNWKSICSGGGKINHPNSTFRYRVQLKTHTVKPVFYSLNCSVVFLSIISITSAEFSSHCLHSGRCSSSWPFRLMG